MTVHRKCAVFKPNIMNDLPQFKWILKKKNDITFFAKTNYRNKQKPVGIKEQDRFSHTFIIGKTGVGKSTLMKTMIKQDIDNSNGFALFDPHGDLAEAVIKLVPT